MKPILFDPELTWWQKLVLMFLNEHTGWLLALLLGFLLYLKCLTG